MTGVEMWLCCAYGLAFGSGDEFSRLFKEERGFENYGCDHSVIVKSGDYEMVRLTDGSTVARLCGVGKINDPEVINALSESCEHCQYFMKR